MPSTLWLLLLLRDTGSTTMLNKDVYLYFRDQAVIRHCEPHSRSTGPCTYISPGGEIVHGRDLHNEVGSGKQMLMDLSIRGILQEIPRTSGKWLSFLMVYTAAGPTRREAFPVLGFGKKDPKKQPGLLIPNPFFGDPVWWDEMMSAALKQSTSRPWRDRSSRALFRGACGPGAWARFQLLTLDDPENRLDVGFTKVDGYDSLETCVKDMATGNRTQIDFVLQHRIKDHVPQTNYSFYRYLLHMPGSASGAYSRNLQYLWAHGAIVLIWKHAAQEWYYTHLKDGVHYVSIDASNVYDVLRDLDANPKKQLHLRRGGRHFLAKFLSGRSLVDRWRALLDVLEERQTSEPPRIHNATACTCDQGLLDRYAFAPCQKCSITQKKGRTLAKFVGLLPKM